MKNTIPILTIIFLTALQSLQADFREFTDKQGRTMKFELVSVVGDEVRLKREDGNAFNVDPSIFVEKDQEFIMMWMLTKLNERDGLFKISARTSKGKVEKNDDESIDRRSWEEYYKIELENKSDLVLEDLTIEYKMWVFHMEMAADKRSDGKEQIISGSAALPFLKGRGEFKFDSVKAKLESTDLKSGWSYIGGGKGKSEDTMEGIRIRILYKDKVIYNWANPSKLLTDYKWGK